MIEWDNKYLLDIAEIDEQHKVFFNIIKKELKQNNNLNFDELAEIINYLENYLKEHFNTEEKLLEESGYVNIESHKAQHSFFVDKINEMKLELNYNNPMLYIKLIDFMKKWFLSHIINEDKKYKETVISYLKKKNYEV